MHTKHNIWGEYAGEYDPPVYHYTYTVDDDYTGAKVFADEARDEHATHGSYEVIEKILIRFLSVRFSMTFTSGDNNFET